MLIDILNKILLVLFFMSCLNIVRHGYYLIAAIISSTEEEPKKYKIVNISLYLLCVSIAYVLSVITTGISI